MKHVVQLVNSDFKTAAEWARVIFYLLPTADPTEIKSVHLTVETVFFEPT